MKIDKDSKLILNSKVEENNNDIITHIKGISQVADIDVKNLSQGFSHHVGMKKWDSIVDIIEDEYNNYDGFVITSGADTMGYLAAGLSFAIQNLGKPIVLTGSRRSIYELRTDARMNLINSLFAATSNLSGVFIVFGSKVILGTRATRTSRVSMDAFSTCNQEDFALTNNILYSLSKSRRSEGHDRCDKKTPMFNKGFDNNILCLAMTPDLDIKFLENIPDNKLKAVIFETIGTGIVPNNFVSTLINMKERNIPVIVVIRCQEGTTTYTEFKIPEQEGMDLNIIEAYDMSMECACSKCMWMLAQNISYENFKLIFQENIVGEIDKTMHDNILNDKHYVSFVQYDGEG